MIWLCGDTHGEIDIYKVEDFFDNLQSYDEITKEDYLIILGDVGVSDNFFVQKRLSAMPCTVLWVDGNHDNFDALEEYPVEEWHGGKVQYIAEDIIHLMRGQIFEIEGHTFFTFGGGYSIDKWLRQPHISWWPQEMPSEEEYAEGESNLAKADYRVDYILSHTCPEFIAEQLTNDMIEGEEEIRQYFNEISEMTDFDMWYFGHWHIDECIDNFRCLWYDIVELGE